MYLILMNRVVLGVDGFINDQLMGSQIRIWFFGLCYYKAWGDKDPDGNGYNIWLGLSKVNEVL